MSDLTTITLDPEKWLRGVGDEGSVLWDSQSQKGCCIGLAMLQLGASESDIAGRGAIDDLENYNGVPKALRWMIHGDPIPVYSANDERFIPPAERVEKINAITEQHGLRFVLQETP